jgi:hypothetical protein
MRVKITDQVMITTVRNRGLRQRINTKKEEDRNNINKRCRNRIRGLSKVLIFESPSLTR